MAGRNSVEERIVSLRIEAVPPGSEDALSVMASLRRSLEGFVSMAAEGALHEPSPSTRVDVYVLDDNERQVLSQRICEWLAATNRAFVLTIEGEGGESTISDLNSPLANQLVETSVDIALGVW